MPPLDRLYQRVLVPVITIVVASTLILFTLTSVSQPTWLPASSHTVPADYLQDQQQAFNATGHSNTTWDCTCYTYDSSEPLPEIPEIVDSSNATQPEESTLTIQVPESLPEPPAALMNKINANLVDGRVLVIATANYGMRDYMYNWIESLKRTNETRYLIFCLDDKLYTHLVNAGYEDHAATIPEEWFHQQVASNFEDYFSPQYKAITHAKTLVVQRLLYLDITVFFSDIDIVWLRPRMREYIKTLLDIREETHVVFQQEGLDERQINSGFFMMRPYEDMKRMLAETIRLQDSNEGLTQQGAMNRALDPMILDLRSTSVVLLDVIYFPNGYAYFDHNLSNSLGVDPYILHANYRVAGDKKKELETRGYWYVDEEWLKQVDAMVEESWEEQTDAIVAGNGS
ncbi:hypothetical protein LRAMOSA03255 [Lichtheimia ramosa]|uniref:Nucleotide-diphospho-sugar transferase domain-containing protein n=1 Tax=Lichtheimia ramosa TaxID=688394 RepID=A0A077WTT7_9FUNG|nr:hypothetical protein LRAMOSA03255 [Lichtheimia ramosa]